MTQTRRIEVRVHRTQYERIKNNATAKGYKTISSYLRSLALDKDLFLDKRIVETSKNVEKILSILQKDT